ncbi:MAG: hypothetical protein KAG34_01310 [Cocleimonas sp.]|nr:hypothetical protein [Cocleimonas sp.]
MLQREMDSTVDYGIPLIEPKKGFLEKLFKTDSKSKLKDKIPTITRKANHSVSDRVLNTVSKKALTWGWLKYLGRLGVPAQVLSIVAFGTLLGAAYAVTMQTGNRQLVEGDLSVGSTSAPQENIALLEQTPAPVVMQVEPELQSQKIEREAIFQQILPVASLEQDVESIIESEEIGLKEKDVTDPSHEITTQTREGQFTEGELSVADTDSIPDLQEDALLLEQKIQKKEAISQQTSSIALLEQDLGSIIESEATEFNVIDVTESNLMLSLNSSIDELQKTVNSPKSLSPEESDSRESAPTEVITSELNKYDQKRIKELQQQILSVKQKTAKYDQSNLRLEGKLELLTVKNRALSNQLRQLDDLFDSLK